VVSFYFGARHQAKGQEFQRELAATIAAVPNVVDTIRDVQALRDVTPDGGSDTPPDGSDSRNFSDNPALADWAAAQKR
jgi:hypothetical protein